MSDERPRILIFTGDGKGKTTAAMGIVLRASGHGMPAFVLQFVKSDQSTGERAGAANLPHTQFVQVGMGFLPPADDERFAAHKAAAEAGLKRAAQAVVSGVYPVVVLDEICYAVSRGLIAESAVVAICRKAPPGMVLVLTGRGATPGLIDLADTVTDMRPIKHGMDIGIKAQKGVEF